MSTLPTTTTPTPELGHVLMVCGDQSGVGKTSACIGLLNALALRYTPEEIAYIKPCTQCESVQLLWKFYHNMGITCRGIGPIVYRAGFTQECIDNQHGTRSDRLKLINDVITELRTKHKFVLVDGVGYPGVGSCVGCSNRDVAQDLGCPVLMISRPGIGNMIDSCVMNIEYMAYKDVVTIGSIVNKVPMGSKKISYHSGDKIKEYVNKFFSTYTYTTRTVVSGSGNDKERNQDGDFVHKVSIYGFVPAFTTDDDGSCATSCATSCALKPNVSIEEFDLEMVEGEWVELSQLLKAQQKSVDYPTIFNDVAKFYSNNDTK